MCSRYNLTSPPEAVRSYFAVSGEEWFPPRYNIAPTQPVQIVRLDAAGRRELRLVRWGLIPRWVKDPASFATLINARAETAAEKPSFRGAVRHKRCLVPADGFYEWTGTPGAKQPYLIRPANGGPIAFAGIFEDWIGADGSELETMAILTIRANVIVGKVHDRMPAILPPEKFAAWLDCRSVDTREALDLLVSPPDDLLEVVRVSRKLNSSRNEGAELLDPDG